MAFIKDNFMLKTKTAEKLYDLVKDLPIIDYHCHLSPKQIAENYQFRNAFDLFLGGDHYKWRQLRTNGIDEEYITGSADEYEKFKAFARTMPLLIGNPLYHWTHLELKRYFDIDKTLNEETCEEIWNICNAKLAQEDFRAQALILKSNVEVVCTTDDPADTLEYHAQLKNFKTKVLPTFRPDKLLTLAEDELNLLSQTVGYQVETLDDFVKALEQRLVYFVEHNCKIADHGFASFPSNYPTKEQADKLFANRATLTDEQKQSLFGFLLVQCAKLYHKHGILMQLHFGVTRNVNPQMLDQCGVDAGFDVIASPSNIEDVIAFFQQLDDNNRPQTVLYTLNDANLKALACVTGAYKNVKMGPAWWFNDTVWGIRHNLQTIAEYSCLGTNFGMLTDSRSFSSYVRFDFFRRLLANYLGDLVEKGEYDMVSATTVAQNICYYNIKNTLGE